MHYQQPIWDSAGWLVRFEPVTDTAPKPRRKPAAKRKAAKKRK